MAKVTTVLPLGAVRRDGNTDAFLEAASRGEFLLRRCRACSKIGGPQEARCVACGDPDSEWIPAAGGARIVSWSVIHSRGLDGLAEPRAITVIAEFDEGPWWWSQLVDADPGEIFTGRRLEVAFAPADGAETLPVFKLA